MILSRDLEPQQISIVFIPPQSSLFKNRPIEPTCFAHSNKSQKSSMFLSPAGKTRTSLSVDNDDVEGEKSGYKKAEESRKLTNNNHLPSELTNSTKTGVPTSVSFHHLLTCPIASCPAQAYSCPSANSSQSPFLFDSGLFIIPRPFSLEPSTSSPPTNSGTSR